jgi:hypothetical protein
LSHCRSGGGGLRLTRTEEIRFEPDALFIEFFEHFKKKIKISPYNVYFYLLQILHRYGLTLVYGV